MDAVWTSCGQYRRSLATGSLMLASCEATKGAAVQGLEAQRTTTVHRRLARISQLCGAGVRRRSLDRVPARLTRMVPRPRAGQPTAPPARRTPCDPPGRVRRRRAPWHEDTLIVSSIRPKQSAHGLVPRTAALRESIVPTSDPDATRLRVPWVRPYVLATWVNLDPRTDYAALRPWLDSVCWGRDVA